MFGFQERVDSWDVTQRQTAVPSKAHKPNALPLLREELSSLLNCACYVVYQTKLVGNVLSSRGIIFFGLFVFSTTDNNSLHLLALIRILFI